MRLPESIPLLAKCSRTLHRIPIRGATRLTLFLARRFKSLQAVPVALEDDATLFADLRLGSTHGILAHPRLPRDDVGSLIRKVVRQNTVAFDIGAHIGLYTILLSRLVGCAGSVYAFEPNAEVLPALKLTAHRLGNVSLFSFALGDRQHDAILTVPADPSMASLVDWTGGACGQTHAIHCEIRPLDNLIEFEDIPTPQFIKCDVEGAELLVFRGAAKILDRVEAPLVLFEVNTKAANAFGFAATAAMDFMAGLASPAYKFFKVDSDGALHRCVSVCAPVTNVLAVPLARLADYPEFADLCK